MFTMFSTQKKEADDFSLESSGVATMPGLDGLRTAALDGLKRFPGAQECFDTHASEPLV